MSKLDSRPDQTSETVEAAFLAFAVESGFLEGAAAVRATAAMRRSSQSVDVALSELGLLGDAKLAEAQSAFLQLPLATRGDYPEDALQIPGLTPEFLRRTAMMPVAMDGDEIVIVSARPLQTAPIRAVEYFVEKSVRLRVASKSELEAAFKSAYGEMALAEGAAAAAEQLEAADDDLERLKDLAREAPIIRLVARLVSQAVEGGASDIHLEPGEVGLRVRNRIDGALRTTETLSRNVTAGVTTRLKILAQLNIAERRLPQDGRMRINVRGREVDLRMSTTPTLHGESIVLRILDRATVSLDFGALGFEPAAQEGVRAMIGNPDGIVLVTGPTGSGKTTTLYAALLELNREQAKIFTVEDPIEYQLPGISQIQVKPAIELDFVACLRSILRQDPDIIMIGEIRDAAAARIAIQAALTGRLVLSTLHTNSAAASITRLIDMGVENYLVASTLRGIIAQRLVRRLCPSCRTLQPVDARLAAHLGASEAAGGSLREAGQARGCEACGQTGYLGRTTIAEILPIDARIKSLILENAPEAAIEAHMRAIGIPDLRQSALTKVAAGETTLQEVLRITRAAV